MPSKHINVDAGILREFRSAEMAARQHVDRGEFAAAARQLRRCHQLMLQYADQPGVAPTVQRMRLEQAEQFLTRALQAEAQANRGEDVPTPLAAVPEKSASDDYQMAAESLITQVEMGWDEIGGLAETKETIQLSYALGLVKQPEKMAIQPTRRLLFYGPPGTGKTMLAAAMSHELDATFFNARIPDLMSQYFGESSKLLSGLYAAAAIHAPSVVFLDEIDALSRQRGGGQESGAERRLLNTFLGELDGLQAKRDDAPFIITAGATNVPWDLDRAIISRFSGGLIHVPLPDADARRQILEILIYGKGHSSQIAVDELVAQCEGYSGRELEQISGIAVHQMIRRANPDLLSHSASGQESLRNYQLRTESLNRQDFKAAFSRVRPSTTHASAQRYLQWRESAS